MKKLLALVLALVLLVTLAACAGAPATPAPAKENTDSPKSDSPKDTSEAAVSSSQEPIYVSVSCAMINYIHPTDFKADLSIKFLMMLMLGGIGSIPGIIVGCSVVTLLPELLRVLDDYYMLIFSVILLLFAVLKPFGLVSIWRDIQGKIIRRGARFEATRKETENDP